MALDHIIKLQQLLPFQDANCWAITLPALADTHLHLGRIEDIEKVLWYIVAFLNL